VILGVALARLFCGLCLAMPLASVLSEAGLGQRAEGDRALFESGGYLLVEVLRLHGATVTAAARGLLPVLALGLVLTSLGNGALLLALQTQGRLRGSALLSAAFSRLPALCAIAVGTALTQGLVLLVAAVLADGLPAPLSRPQQGTALQVALWLVALLAAGALGGFGDVAKAALVRYESSAVAALGRAWRVVSLRPTFGLLGWVPFSLPFAAAVLGASWLAGAVDVSRPGAWRVAAVFAAHQSVIVVAVACRAAWFAAALRAVCAAPSQAPALP
jgi:hypothetical protein